MDYRHRHQIIVFLYYYLCAACFFVIAAFATGGTKKAYLAFVIAMALCYFGVSFKRSHKRKKEKDPNRERRCHMTVFGMVLAAAVLFQQPDDLTGETGVMFVLGELLLFVLFLGVISVYIYADYFREKYLTMYVNPCVGEETIRRFEKNTSYALKRFFLFLGVGTLLLFLIVATVPVTEGEYKYKGQTSEPAKPAQSKKEQQKQIEEKERERRSPFTEVLLRILMRVMQVILVVLFVIGIVTVLFFLLRKFFSVRLPQFSRVEKIREKYTDGIDEYIPLCPVSRRGEEFPGDPNGKIRKYFTRYIKKKSGGKVDVSLTPQEMAETYLATEGQPVSENERMLVELYEKARYSGAGCSAREAEKILIFHLF